MHRIQRYDKDVTSILRDTVEFFAEVLTYIIDNRDDISLIFKYVRKQFISKLSFIYLPPTPSGGLSKFGSCRYNHH